MPSSQETPGFSAKPPTHSPKILQLSSRVHTFPSSQGVSNGLLLGAQSPKKLQVSGFEHAVVDVSPHFSPTSAVLGHPPKISHFPPLVHELPSSQLSPISGEPEIHCPKKLHESPLVHELPSSQDPPKSTTSSHVPKPLHSSLRKHPLAESPHCVPADLWLASHPPKKLQVSWFEHEVEPDPQLAPVLAVFTQAPKKLQLSDVHELLSLQFIAVLEHVPPEQLSTVHALSSLQFFAV